MKLLSDIFKKKEVDGCLRVDRSDPTDGPYLFLELSKDVSEICGRKYVTFEVKAENYISQE